MNFSSVALYQLCTCCALVKNETKPINHLKTPNPQTYFQYILQYIFQVILSRFGLLLLVWDVDLSVYRMLLTRALSLCKCVKRHMVMPPYIS